MEISELRERIDGIDDKIVKLFCERMRVSADIAQYKSEMRLPVRDPEREACKLADVLGKTDVDLCGYTSKLYSLILELSCAHQERVMQTINTPDKKTQ